MLTLTRRRGGGGVLGDLGVRCVGMRCAQYFCDAVAFLRLLSLAGWRVLRLLFARPQNGRGGCLVCVCGWVVLERVVVVVVHLLSLVLLVGCYSRLFLLGPNPICCDSATTTMTTVMMASSFSLCCAVSSHTKHSQYSELSHARLHAIKHADL